ncbi:MAG: TonB-dependent receptor [Gammaproteobacteria bacterium]|nr:TonB-dependent receptor [Gammaproteobacteria bacterium]NND54436.1 TonB-dependent receptor [Gammaproteobacteria bacterium]
MAKETLDTHQKALAINLDDNIYGTFAEIGAAQEVARWYFRVGGAAGTVAKTMSAYDMLVSDEIYGKADRYVSRERVEAMLDKEYSLLIRRLSDSRGDETRFFALCNTVAARNFAGDNECHGWVGLRFQSEPGGEPNTIVLHVNMMDEDALAQQEAMGILGVNLIHVAFKATEGPVKGLDNLGDNIGESRIEVDVASLSGPVFDSVVDPAHVGMAMIRGGLAQAVLFDRNGNQFAPSGVTRKRPIIIKRTSARYSSVIDSAEFAIAEEQLRNEVPDLEKPPLKITEFSISSVHATMGSDEDRHLQHLRELIAQEEWVLLTSLRQSYKLTDYLRRYSRHPVRFVMGVSTFAMLLSEQFYVDSAGGMLEATGRLYGDTVRVYVQPMSCGNFRSHLDSVGLGDDWVSPPASCDTSDGAAVTLHNIEFSGPTRLIHRYLIESGWVQPLNAD